MSTTATDIKNEWDIIIKPDAGLFIFDLKGVWKYRDLMWLFVKRDFAAQYKQTILGPLWHLIQPLFTTLMFVLIFNKIANISTDTIEPPLLFYMSGITLWNYFANCVTNTSNTFIANAGIFGKVYFPRLVLPLSIVISNMVRFVIQFGLLLGFMIWYSFNGYPVHFNLHWLFIPVLLAIVAGIGLGTGIIISSLTTKYRDLTVLIGFVMQLAMYVTPIVYPLSYLKGKRYLWLIKLNPVTSLVEAFRYALFGKGTYNLAGLAYSSGFMLIVLTLGILIFNRVERTFMDTV